jgi:hypothetical protein
MDRSRGRRTARQAGATGRDERLEREEFKEELNDKLHGERYSKRWIRLLASGDNRFSHEGCD